MTFHPGPPAALSGAVSYRPPLPSDNCPAAFAHINYWIQDCIQNHEQCKYTVSNSRVDEIQGPKLPRRVLDLGCANDTDLSLVETHDERGNYCALSYCWGPPGWNHLLTTRANIESHFDGIKFDQLPRTLQDAVIVTRRIGIRYLWIDSLCIIQGDTADWTLESAKMAEVYQNAYLVIAASGAEHPGEGCFSNRRRCPTAVEVPYLSETGQAMGSILLSMCLPEEQYPALGPLWERGWALQERRLARRMLHFMPRGMSWKCTELESGERYPYDMSQYPGWDSILQEFSECQLTYEKDRLVAIEGLGRAVQEANGDRYTFGILESQLPELLLWTLSSDELDTSEDLVSVPTWCWASKGGSKIFWGTQYILGKSLIKKSGLTIEGSGVLRIEGVLQECRVSSNESDGLELPFLHGRLSDLLEDTKPLYLFEITSATFDFRGIAAFDREYSEKVYVLVLNKLKYGSGDGLEKVCFNDFCSSQKNRNRPVKNIGFDYALLI